jgi:HEPN domain-containing protein
VTTAEVEYRLRVAEGFLDECRQDVALNRWRSAVDNAQLAVENAAKAVLALIAPVGRTHNPAPLLRQALDEGRFDVTQQSAVQRLAECAEVLGFDIHVQTDYGDEFQGLTPWELFDAQEAGEALALAEEAVNLAGATVHGILP